MRNIVTALFMLLSGSCFAQFTALPTIDHFGGMALDSSHNGGDSSFCRGVLLTIHGHDFTSADSLETWDSTGIWLGGYPNGIQCQTTTVNDSLIEVRLPSYLLDTCVALILRKNTTTTIGTMPYVTFTSICLIGDSVQLNYSHSSFCLGDSNPHPQTLTILGDSGTFFNAGGTPWLLVTQTGEIPLHSGVIGTHGIGYATGNPHCPDTALVTVSILPQLASFASINGSSTVSSCPTGQLQVDSIYPVGGSFRVNGLPLVDDSLGVVDLNGATPGLYQLSYHPALPCFDSFLIEIEVLLPDTALVSYPIGPVNNVQHHCQNAGPLVPVFQSGYAGGNFVALPNGIAFGPGGTIFPAASSPGLYTIVYHTLGDCPDTTVVSLNLSIDTVQSASFQLTEEEVCEGQAVILLDSVENPGLFAIVHDDSVLASFTNALVPLTGLAPNRTYHVRHTTAGQCPDTLTEHFTLIGKDNAAFAYDPAFYCLGDPDPLPLIQGTGGGLFIALSPQTVVAPAGRLDLAGSGPGNHIVQYQTLGACPDTASFAVSINNGLSAAFSYPVSSFCTGDTAVLPTISNGGGLFSADTNGLDLDSLTGLLNPAGSLPGTYQIQHAFNNSCQTTFSLTISIGATDSTTTIAYPTDTFCRDSAVPVPQLLGDSLGDWIVYGGASFFNPSNGSIDLENSPNGGPFVVVFDVEDRCAIDPADSFYILPPPSVNFSYVDSIVCLGASPIYPVLLTVPTSNGAGGAFSFSPNGLAIDQTGAIDPTSSQPGGYVVTYQTNGSCPGSSQTTVAIHPLPNNLQLTLDPGSTICEGGELSGQVNADDATEFGFLINEDTIRTSFNFFSITNLDHGDTVRAWVQNPFGCLVTVSNPIEVLPRPAVFTNNDLPVVVGTNAVEVELETDLDQSLVDWWLLGESTLLDSGSIGPLNAGQPFPLSLFPQSNDTFFLSSLALVIAPYSGSCKGLADTLPLILHPENSPFFIPEVITPNGDGLNDLWQISWSQQVRPEDYQMDLFNRSGGRVANMNPIQQYWEPGNLPDGVYWWRLSHQGNPFEQGGLTIVRRK